MEEGGVLVATTKLVHSPLLHPIKILLLWQIFNKVPLGPGWRAPPIGTIKIHVDAAVEKNLNRVTVVAIDG